MTGFLLLGGWETARGRRFVLGLGIFCRAPGFVSLSKLLHPTAQPPHKGHAVQLFEFMSWQVRFEPNTPSHMASFIMVPYAR